MGDGRRCSLRVRGEGLTTKSLHRRSRERRYVVYYSCKRVSLLSSPLVLLLLTLP